MVYLILTILVTSSLFLIFKLFERFRVHTFQAIVANYITCVIVGLLSSSHVWQHWDPEQHDWIYFSLFMGGLFIVIFYLIAMTAQRVGVAAVSIASKISMIIPILSSLFFLKSSVKTFDVFNYTGLVLSLFAVFLTSFQAKSPTKTSGWLLLLPITVFFFTGIADSVMNYANVHYLNEYTGVLFSIATFAFSSVFGLIMISYRLTVLKTPFSPRSWLAGVALGIPNYFSIVLLLRTLSAFHNDGAFMFPILNIGIILTSITASVLLFQEKLSPLNRVGIGLSIVAIVLISYQELLHGGIIL